VAKRRETFSGPKLGALREFSNDVSPRKKREGHGKNLFLQKGGIWRIVSKEKNEIEPEGMLKTKKGEAAKYRFPLEKERGWREGNC